ncbi:DEHA2E02288p [Debaryomyces hansenii CBS767]|uniref:DEHA2E02288p n=1 Tax=Debaryomyces hansenii (strain ATCC 36239 / CBS 767 / BCRC 21394 / JCM 1990 / NBRC 0083 / IGC 2968) TaxID=284592 RepID=Q6BQT8_DEBHA|nr:DEHA2E02288p [Debaryomyces hansenii CBS767]CAG87646.2 DEHA2E02288p [Debaryomyces hansenii CBS767]|eukprot:XP_459432.2 DEHA2E02288p [Debaryomyces hansenii CBS767]
MSENTKEMKTQDMKILEGGKVMKVQKTRQRKILSCIYCHSKKIKCSRVQPVCNNCDKLGLECKYFINERVSRGGKKSSRSVEPQTAIKVESTVITDIAGEGLDGAIKMESDARTDSSSSYSDHNISPMSPKSNENSNESVTTNDDIVLCKEDSQFADLYFGLNMQAHSPMNQLNQPLNGMGMPRNPNGSPMNLNNTLLQTPVMNSGSNNITNNFFNTNYMSNPPDESYQFNLSSFPFNHENIVNRSGMTPPLSNINTRVHSSTNSHSNSQTNLSGLLAKSNQQNRSNFIDNQNNNSFLPNSSNNNKSAASQLSIEISNSLNPYSSNPATTVNFLYGTNTYYDNENLLDDLLKHLPSSRERSFELINRYVNSVHILLPLMVNLQDFIEEHTKFWDEHDRMKENSSSDLVKADTSSSGNNPDIFQFYTLYYPILYASTVSEFEEYDNLLLNQDIDNYLKGFNKICQYYNYPHGLRTIPLLLGNVIIQSTSPNPSSMEMSQIIRYAKFLQFHKDPILTLRINDWEVIKFRRLLWWVIFGLDALTSHNHCLPPICKYDDFNVVMPDEEEPVFNENGSIKEKKLNVAMLSMNVKFQYDRILSELVYQLHNGLSNNITGDEINEIKLMIMNLFYHIHESIKKMTDFYKMNPPQTVSEMNLINFITNHSWSFVDRALMLLHKKILLRDRSKDPKHDFDESQGNEAIKYEDKYEINRSKNRGGILSLSQYEDTFGQIQESNIINNFDNSTISQLKFSQHENFSYENLGNNLIPSILHNLNDFLKYNDFIKFGKFNWYVKRTIPLDSIILMLIIITVKFKYEFMTSNELVIYVKLINKALFILNRKWFKNEKYKRMLSLTNSVWRFILEKYNIINLITQHNLGNENIKSEIEFCDSQVAGYMNMNELFNVMDVPQPIPPQSSPTFTPVSNLRTGMKFHGEHLSRSSFSNQENATFQQNSLITKDQYQYTSNDTLKRKENDSSNSQCDKNELRQLSDKIYYSLRNNFVDINDYCSFYISLENILHELMDYIQKA